MSLEGEIGHVCISEFSGVQWSSGCPLQCVATEGSYHGQEVIRTSVNRKQAVDIQM